MDRRNITVEEYIDKTYAKGNRTKNSGLTAPESPEEYLGRGLGIDALSAMLVGSVEGLHIQPEEMMLNNPLWLGEKPEITDISYEVSCETLVIGAGPSGSTAVLRLAEQGKDVLCLETQTWEEYDAYACDMASYNSNFFRSLGVPEYDLMEVYNEYMRKALGHAHPKLVRDYVTRSGETIDWVLSRLPQEYIDRYAHATHYKGNKHFSGETAGQKSFIGMLQWRDDKTNANVWPFVMRLMHKKAQEHGAKFLYGTRAICLEQNENGTVCGCIAQDIDDKFFRISCKAVIAAAGDFGGNPDMRLDLCDTVRNLTWAAGNDRTDVSKAFSGGRDGSGIRMLMWAGGKMESGPRAGQDARMNRKPGMPFGGCWPTFGPDGRRFMNETITKFGAIGPLEMLPDGGVVSVVTDSNWDTYCEYQGYGHETMDRSNEVMLKGVRDDMSKTKVGPEGFGVRNFALYGEIYQKIFAANTIEELGTYMGYTGEALENFKDEVAHWNEMCAAGRDSDWGTDKNYLFPIKDAPFYGVSTVLGSQRADGGLCQNCGIITDGDYRVLNAAKQPIPGVYAVGNCCGQRYAVQYHTPTAGNCCGFAMTSGYVAVESVVKYLESR